jgi:hypothetical protein
VTDETECVFIGADAASIYQFTHPELAHAVTVTMKVMPEVFMDVTAEGTADIRGDACNCLGLTSPPTAMH